MQTNLNTTALSLRTRLSAKIWPRIFIVEPNYGTAMAIKTALENEGSVWQQYDIQTSQGPVKSQHDLDCLLRQIAAWQTDIVIIDYLESGANWLCAELKRLPEAPLVIVTCHHKPEIDSQRLAKWLYNELGADYFISKPFNPCDLAALVNQHWQSKTVVA